MSPPTPPESGRKRPVTIRDIARAAGVSAATVSLALRNNPQISAAVRSRIQSVARQLGYRPNPLLAAYQAQVRSLKPVTFQAAIAWISDHPRDDFWEPPWNRPLFEGARARAEALGYTLDPIWIPGLSKEDWKANVRQFERVLRARGIHAVLLPRLDRAHHAVAPWSDFAVACIGRHRLQIERSIHPVDAPCEHHTIHQDDYANTRLALRMLREAGCRRIGLALSIWEDRATDGLSSAACLRQASEWPAKERVPILYRDEPEPVAAWVRKHAVDAVVCSHSDVPKGIELAGRKIPRDVRLAHLNLAADVAGWSGIDRRPDQIGSAAVDLVTAHLVRNERGVPPCAKEVLIEGRWVEGTT